MHCASVINQYCIFTSVLLLLSNDGCDWCVVPDSGFFKIKTSSSLIIHRSKGCPTEVRLRLCLLLSLTVDAAGYEYNERGFGGGFDPTGFGNFGGMDAGGGGGFMTEEKSAGKESGQKVISVTPSLLPVLSLTVTMQSRDKQSLLPLTIKQINSIRAVDDVFRVDDVELHMLKIIGTLLMPQEHSTNFTFRLNDCTGTMECKQWIEKEASAYGKIKALREGAMVKVIGNLREYEGRVHVLVYDVSPLEDWNELTLHMLDVILTHCQRTKGPIPGTGPAAAHGMGIGAFSAASPMGRGGMPMGGGGGPMGMGAGMNLQHAMKKESQNLNDVVYEAYLKGAHSQTGLSYHDALTVLRQKNININQDQLVRAVQSLCEDGRLYTTIDDEHYRPTSDDY